VKNQENPTMSCPIVFRLLAGKVQMGQLCGMVLLLISLEGINNYTVNHFRQRFIFRDQTGYRFQASAYPYFQASINYVMTRYSFGKVSFK